MVDEGEIGTAAKAGEGKTAEDATTELMGEVASRLQEYVQGGSLPTTARYAGTMTPPASWPMPAG